MGDALDVCPEEHFEFDGKTYTLVRTNFDSQAFFAKRLYQNALKAANESRLEVGEAFYLTAVQAVIRDRAAGVYSWGSETVAHAAGTGDGFAHLIFLTLGQQGRDGSPINPGITEALVRKMFQDMAKGREIAQAYNRLYATLDPNANSQAVAAAPS